MWVLSYPPLDAARIRSGAQRTDRERDLVYRCRTTYQGSLRGEAVNPFLDVLWLGVRQEEIIEAQEKQFASTVERGHGFFFSARLLRAFRSNPVGLAGGRVQIE